MIKRIEFIGRSGVGKTTLFNHVVKARRKNDGWKTPNELHVELARNNWPSTDIIKLLGKLALHIPFLKEFHLPLSYYLLKKKRSLVLSSEMAPYRFLIENILDHHYKSLREPELKARSIEFFLNLLLRDIAFLEAMGVDNYILYHDSIIHNSHLAHDKNLYESILDSCANKKHVIHPVAVIYCHLPWDEQFKRRKKRKDSGKGTFVERSMSEKELMELCKKPDNVTKKRDTMEAMGIPILDINMAEPLISKTKEVNAFLRDIVQKNITHGK